MKTTRESDDRPPGDPPPSASDEPRVAAALEDYLAAAEAGCPPDHDEFLARHPDIARALAGCLAGIDLLDAAGRDPASDPRGQGRLGSPLANGPATLGDFRILREVGRGGMGVVYEAEQLSLGRRVALKVLPLAATLDPKHLQRFRNEAQAAAHLHHPNVVPVYAVGCERGVHYYAMQFIEGRNLADVIRDQRAVAAGGPAAADQDFAVGPAAPGERVAPPPTAPYVPGVPAAEPGADTARAATASTAPTAPGPGRHRAGLRLAIQAAEALDYAHQVGVVHRDVKPANLIVDGRGNLWVTDFGLAQCQANPGLTQSGDLVGTLRYMSPEQALATRGVVDHRTDVYSLGVTLYELLTGRPALPGTDRQELLRQVAAEDPVPPRRLDPTVPAEVETIVLKAAAKAPEDRYATAQALADDLRRFLEDRPILARRPSAARRAVKWARRHRTLVSALGASLGLLAAGVVALSIGFAFQEGRLAEERGALARDREAARQETARRLYRAKLDHAAALRLARTPGYRAGVWADLREAVALDVPDPSPGEVRELAAACLGDPVGLPAADPVAVTRPIAPALPERFRELIRPGAGGRLAFAPATNRVALWDGGGAPPAEADSPLGYVHDLAFAGDRLLLAGCEEGVAAWSVPALTVRWSARVGVVMAVAAHPHGRLFALAGRQVELWSLTSNRPVAAFPSPGPETKVEFTADGRFLLALRGDAVAAAWPVLDTPEKRSLAGHAGGTTGLAFSPDGSVLASGSKDQTAKVWDARTGELIFTAAGHAAQIEAVAFSPDGRLLATADNAAGEVRVWDWRAGREVARTAGPGTVWRLAFGPAGRFLAAGGEGGVATWAVRPAGDGVSLEPFLKLYGPGTIDLAVHPNGAELALLDRSGRLSAYDLRRAGMPRPVGPTARLVVRSLTFDTAGAAVTFVSADGALAVLDWRTGAVRETGQRGLFQVARGPGGWVATPTADGAVAVHDLAADRPVLALPPEEGEAWGVALAPDGRRLAVGRSDGGLAVWDLAEVRGRLAEFGTDVPSPASTGSIPAPPPAAEFEELVRRNRARTELNEVEEKLRKAWVADDYAAARGHGLRALALREAIGQADPDEEGDRYQLVGSLLALGRAQFDFREFDLARRQFDRALALADRLAADFPTVPKYRESAANAHFHIALVLRATGRDREAVAEHRKAIASREAVAAEFPDQPRPREQLALAYSNLGVLLQKTGDDREVEACYRRALALFERLAADFPNTPDHPVYRTHLAAARQNLGMVLARTGRPAGAEPELRAALDLREKLVADQPGSADSHHGLALTLEALGVFLRGRGDADGAVRLLRRAVAEGRETVRLVPGNPAYRRACGDHYFNLADNLRLLGRHAEAVRVAAELAEFAPDDRREFVRGARLTARCVPAAAADPALSALGRGLVPELYALQAVGLLEKAAARGAKGLDALARDDDFAPLRPRPDFRKLVTKPPD